MDESNFRKLAKSDELGPRLHDWPLPGKVLVTMIVVMISLGLGVAGGQIVVHDIIPTFWGKSKQVMSEAHMAKEHSDIRGDLFAEPLAEEKATPFYQTDEFIFALKFTHIHIFGMSAIFILMGFLVLFLNLSNRACILLIVLPFIGVALDLAAVWLRIFVHPVFFWLHIPGGMLFMTIYAIDAVLIFFQIWIKPNKIKGAAA